MGLIAFPSDANFPDSSDAFLGQTLVPVYDQYRSRSDVGVGRGRTFGSGYFTMVVETAGYSLVDEEGRRRARAMVPWSMKMQGLGAYSDVPIVNALHPTFPVSQTQGVVLESYINLRGDRETSLTVPRPDIEEDMYVSVLVGGRSRLFMVFEKPTDSTMVLFPSMALAQNALINRATVFRGEVTEDNEVLPAPRMGEIVYPVINLTEVV